MDDTQELLRSLHLPDGDNHAHAPSVKRFPGGGQFRIEIPSCEGPRVFAQVLQAAAELQVPIHRVSQGSGIMLLTNGDIREMAAIGREHGIEVCLFVGPRASFETGAQVLTPAGRGIAGQHRGADQLRYALDDIRRACELGIRSILIADLGLVAVVHALKQRQALPPSLVVKSSVSLAVANPAMAQIFEKTGVNTLNLATDLSPAQIGAIRAAVEIPLDLYIEVPDSFGGFVRYYEMPRLIEVAAPLYLKFGLRNAPDIYPSGLHIEPTAIAMGRERVRRARIALDLLERHAPKLALAPLATPDLGIPEY